MEHACPSGSTLSAPCGCCTQSYQALEKARWVECLSSNPLLGGWALSTIPAKHSSLVRTVHCCRPAAAANGHIRLEIEIPRWAPEPFPPPPPAATHLGDPPVRLVAGASVGRAGGWRKPRACQPGSSRTALLGCIGGPPLWSGPVAGSQASRPPLCQQLPHKPP